MRIWHEVEVKYIQEFNVLHSMTHSPWTLIHINHNNHAVSNSLGWNTYEINYDYVSDLHDHHTKYDIERDLLFGITQWYNSLLCISFSTNHNRIGWFEHYDRTIAPLLGKKKKYINNKNDIGTCNSD